MVEIEVRRGDVLSAWSGIRPLIKDPTAASTESLVRNHLIHVSDSGLITIAGGKWTTYRHMAEETIDKAIQVFSLSPLCPSWTEKCLLVGSHGFSKTAYLKLIQQYGFETEVGPNGSNEHIHHAFYDAHAPCWIDCSTFDGRLW